MRIVDADILSYALLESHIATPYAKPIILKGIRGELELNVTGTTILESYNTLYWYYRVRPRKKILEKLEVIVEGLNIVNVPVDLGVRIAKEENVPLGDGLLMAAAIEERIPIIVSNDKHVERLAVKFGFIYENLIPESVRKAMGGTRVSQHPILSQREG